MAKRDKGDLFNLDNLEEAKKIIQEINNILNNTSSAADVFMKDNVKLIESYKKLSELSDKVADMEEASIQARNENFRNQMAYLTGIVKAQSQIIDQQNESIKQAKENTKAIKEQEKALNDVKDKWNKTAELYNSFDNFKVQGTTKNDIENSFKEVLAQTKQQNAKLDDMKQSIIDAVIADNDGEVNEQNYSTIQAQITKQLSDSSGEFYNASQKMSLSTNLANTVVNTFKEAVNTFASVWKSGYTAQSSAYESTFTNISVRTGTTRGEYQSAQTTTNELIDNMGLTDNVSMSDVQELWNELINKGIDLNLTESEDLQYAIETAMTSTIVPYLDVSDTYYQQLVMQGTLDQKQLRGISTAMEDQLGSNYTANKYLQDMIDQLSPVSQYSEYELGLQYAESAGTLEAMRNAGYSDQAISEIYNEINAIQTNGYDLLTTGSTTEKIAMSNILQKNIDMSDTSAVLQEYLAAAGETSSWMGEYANTNTAAFYSDLATSKNLSNVSTSTYLEMLNNDLAGNIDSYISAGESVAKSLNSASETATSEYTSGTNQTQKSLQNITVENWSTWMALWQERLGNWFDTIGTLIKGVISALGLYLGGKAVKGVASKLLGGATSGTSLVTAGANAVGSGLMDVGLAAGYSGSSIGGAIASGTGAVLGTTALVAGGTALGVKNAQTASEQWSEGNYSDAVTSGAGAAAGIGAAALTAGTVVGSVATGAGLAAGIGAAVTNPVGWALLAVAGTVYAVNAAGDAMEEYSEAANHSSKYLEEQVEANVNALKDSNTAYEESLQDTINQIEDTNNLENAKQLAIEAGITTQSELTDQNIDTKDALLELCNAYLDEVKEFNEESEETYELLEEERANYTSQYTEAVNSMMQYVMGGKGWNLEADELDDNQKESLKAIYNTMYDYLSANESTLTDDQQDVFDYLKKLNNDVSSWSDEDISTFIDYMDKDNTAFLDTANKIYSESDYISALLSYSDNGNVSSSAVKSALFGEIGYFTDKDTSTAQTYLEALLQEDDLDTDTVRNYLDYIKEAMEWDSIDDVSSDGMKDTINEIVEKYNIGSFAEGLDYVPEDNYLANLHEGEAVLTADTAGELRTLIEEYRATNETSISIDAIIQNQTDALLSKMNEIITAITGVNNEDMYSDIVSNSFSNTPSFANMVRMKSTKSL